VQGAIATVDFFVSDSANAAKRLSLVIAAPHREPAEDAWLCRIALADLHPAETIVGRDSVEALALAMAQARRWIAALRDEGAVLTRDRDGEITFDLP
jgi:hypothetical protein